MEEAVSMPVISPVTTMRLSVDLGCERCCKKIGKLICKFPEIRDEIFFVEGNTVMIKVVCCSPGKIKDKLLCKGGRTIRSIEIGTKTPKGKPKEAKEPRPPAEKLKCDKPGDPPKPGETLEKPPPPPPAPAPAPTGDLPIPEESQETLEKPPPPAPALAPDPAPTGHPPNLVEYRRPHDDPRCKIYDICMFRVIYQPSSDSDGESN